MDKGFCTYKIWVDGVKTITTVTDYVLEVKGIKKIGRTAAQDRAARGRKDRPKVFSLNDGQTLTVKEYVAKWSKDNFLKAKNPCRVVRGNSMWV